MRVGLVCAHSSPPGPSDATATGTRQHVARVAAELTIRGHEVRVYDRRDDPDAPESATAPPGYRIERVSAGPAAPLPTQQILPHVTEFSTALTARWSDDWTPDVAHGHFWIGGLAAASAVRDLDVPVVQTFHSLGAEQKRHLGREYAGPDERIPLELALTRALDLAVAQSSDEVDELTRMGLQRAAVAVVPAGVDTDAFTPEGDVAPRERRLRILSVSSLEPGHGQQDVIQALRYVGDAELVIAGGPARSDLASHAEARRLREFADRSGVGEQVTFIGAVPHEQMPAWYRSADVVACTPHYASAGQVPREAMGCGVPVVGYALGAVADTVVDEVTGRLVQLGDIRALGVTLRRLLADDAQRFAYGHAAVDRVRCSYTWDRTAGALERLYERVVRRRHPVVA